MPRAYVFTDYGGAEYQRFVDIEMPTPQAGELLVKVRAASVNPKDVKVREGLSERLEQIEHSVGLGREASGVVRSIGVSITDFAPGDEVFGSVIVGQSGGIAEFAMLRASRSVHKPPSVSFVDAGAMSVAFSTAYDSVEQLALPVDATLLIIGIGGGVGIAAAQMAIARGIKVIGTASPGKQAFVSSIGATHVSYGDGVLERVRAVANRGVDGIFDLVGGDALRELACLLRNRSKLITASDATTAEELGGSKVTRVRSASVLNACLGLVEQGLLKPFVTEVFAFDKAGDAIRRIESGHATGKIVVEVS